MIRRPHLWILKNRIPMPCEDSPAGTLTWGRWLEEHNDERIVAQTDLDVEVRVSTVFLGIDHCHSMDPLAAPILFETMVFGEEKVMHAVSGRVLHYRESLDQWRYSTWPEAERGHEEACQLMKRKLDEALMLINAKLPTQS